MPYGSRALAVVALACSLAIVLWVLGRLGSDEAGQPATPTPESARTDSALPSNGEGAPLSKELGDQLAEAADSTLIESAVPESATRVAIPAVRDPRDGRPRVRPTFEGKTAAFLANAQRNREQSGPAISGKVLDARTGRLCRATICLRAQGSLNRSIRFNDAEQLAEFSFEGLATGTYDVFARTKDGKFGTTTGIRASRDEETPEAVVYVSPGATLNIRYEGRTNGGSYTVSAGSVVLAKEDLQRGVSAKECVPAGPISVRFSCFNPAKETQRDVTLLIGEETEVLFGDDG